MDNHSVPSVAMGRERSPHVDPEAYVVCEKCGGQVKFGDWPYCQGDEKEHRR